MDALRELHPELTSARDLTMGMLEAARTRMPEVSFRRLRHVVTENERVLQARSVLRAGDAQGTGELLAASHESLARDYDREANAAHARAPDPRLDLDPVMSVA